MRPRMTRTLITALSLTAMTAAAGCVAAPAAAPAAGPATGPVAAVSDDAALSFVGGTGGAADSAAEPVKVGFINQDTGVPSFPEATTAAKAAVEYVNAELGGVQGHPLQLVECPVASEAQAQSCAQQMLNDPTIDVIQTGALTVGNASLYNTIAGAKPIMGGNPTSPADFTAENTWFYTPGSPGVNGAIANYIASTMKATSVSVVHSDDPAASGAAKLSVDAMRGAGLDPKVVPFPAGGGDLTGPLVASGAPTSEAIEFLAAGPACLQMAQAQQQLGLTGQIFAVSLCLDPSVKKQLGDYPSWIFGTSYPNVYVDGEDPQVNLYRSVMIAHAGPDTNTGGFAPIVFGSLLDLVKVMNTIGVDALSPETIGQGLAGYTGAAFLGAPDIRCGDNAETPTICTRSARLIEYKGNGEWSDPSGGQWLAATS